jgi:CRISPR-associated protein Cas4
MEQYIQISKINDFLYSPRSLYLHSVFENFHQHTYHEEAQTKGKLNHARIDKGEYASRKRYLQGAPVYSEKYNIGGKIDIFDKKIGLLIERKTRIKNPNIYIGLKYQLWAQYLCLEEMGYFVFALQVRSLEDNKRYPIPRPSAQDIAEFEATLHTMRNFNPNTADTTKEKERSNVSIYRSLEY